MIIKIIIKINNNCIKGQDNSFDQYFKWNEIFDMFFERALKYFGYSATSEIKEDVLKRKYKEMLKRFILITVVPLRQQKN